MQIDLDTTRHRTQLLHMNSVTLRYGKLTCHGHLRRRKSTVTGTFMNGFRDTSVKKRLPHMVNANWFNDLYWMMA